MKKKSLNPLRSLIEFWEIKPKDVIGWDPHKTMRGLFKDLEKEISERLAVNATMISNVWYAKVPEVPQELLSAMKKQGMNPEKVTEAYKTYYYEHVTQPAQERKKNAEKRKKELEEKQRNKIEEKKKNFRDEWS